ncbi:calcium/sodium antiporter [Halobaculum rarum]|uniref:calcium/sodium antiporter n=1 Tax=Halobaculum rarum TaxID=3075122 RepID=UPI0032AE88C2
MSLFQTGGGAVAIDLALVAAAVGGLWVGANWFVAGATRLARRLGLSGLVIGLTVVAFGTSAPEFAVTVDAAVAGNPDISVANVVGSNVVNLGFVLGGAALVRALPTSRELVWRDSLVLVGVTALVLGLLWDLRLERVEGFLLLGLLVGYLAVLVRSGSAGVAVDTAGIEPFERTDAARFVGGLGIVVVSAHLLVASAADLAGAAGVSDWVVGATVVALGTSAPEFVTSVAAARRGRAGLSAGNLVGSCVFNFLGVLGVAAVVAPLPVSPAAVSGTTWLLATVVLVAVLFGTRRVLSKPEGALLIAVNAVNWAVDFLR